MKAHRSFEGGYAERVRFAFGFTVDRHGLCPRDDKTDTDSQYTHFVIARRTIVRRSNPLHEIDAFRQNVSLPGSQWIATGHALAMTSIESGNKVGYARPPQSFSYPLPSI
jgi:hypothetical protein